MVIMKCPVGLHVHGITCMHANIHIQRYTYIHAYMHEFIYKSKPPHYHIQRRQSGLKSGGSWIRVQKNSIFAGKFPKNFHFSSNSTKNFAFSRQISEKFRFLRQFKKKFEFPGKNWPFTATSRKIIL